MKLNLKRASFTALAALSFAILASPAAASAETFSYNVDCDALEDSGTTFYAAAGDTVTLTLTNCSTWEELDQDWNVIDSGSTGATEQYATGDFFTLKSATGTFGFTFNVGSVNPETVPSGELLLTDSITLPANPLELSVGAANDDGEHLLGGDEACGLAADPAEHIYATLDITIRTDGTYTFRGIESDPSGGYLPLGEEHPLEDSFLAVYSDFDPNNPDSGVVGCNDDLNDQFSYDNEDFVEQLEDGTWMEGHQPYFVADLAAGQYTLVLMTWETMSAADWAADWETPASTTFEMWGPTDGLVKGHVEFEQLADTGVERDLAPFAAAAFLISVGGFIAFSRKRRTN